MKLKSRIYKSASAFVAIALLLQLFLPVMVFSQVTAVHAAPSIQPQTANQTEPVEQTVVTQPEMLTNTLAVSRVQSSYQAGSSIVISYTVSNNRPPTTLPDVAPGATITETMDALTDFDFSQDPNTIRNVLLATELTVDVTFGSAVPFADQNGNSLAWNLGDIPPLGSKTAVLTLTPPTSAPDFTNLDTGATAWGTFAGRGVTAVAPPALVAPDNFDQWLAWTMDADIYDTDMLAAAAQIGQDPIALFEYVRGLDAELYEGSLRGTRGTLWSEAGNAADQSSLLIAMLRASGIPARYRHGTLDTTNAQTLIASMFPEPTAYLGSLDPSQETADPINDPDLIAQAQDHWWVEAYLPGVGWTNLDPSFKTAVPGDIFAIPIGDGSDQIAELPDSIRHKVTMRVKVEDYYPLNLGQSGLDHSYPLSHTFRTVELTAEPVAFSHFVHSEYQGGLVFANTIHTYTPYLLLGDQEIVGEPYQDLLTNFPLGTKFHTAVWLQFDLISPNGDTVAYEREIVDKIGYEARVNGGNSNFAFDGDNSQLVSDFDVYTTGFWPNIVPESAVERVKADALAQSQTLNESSQRLQELANQATLSQAEEDEVRVLRARSQENTARLLGNMGLSFAEMSDRMVESTSDGLFIKSYYDAPRLIITGVKPNAGSGDFSMDLRQTAVRTIPFPGQAETAGIGFNIAKGFIESGIEGSILEDSTGQSALTTARISSAAKEQSIEPVFLASDNLHLLDQLDLSEQAKARITTAAAAGKLISIPSEKVQIDGDLHTGWWEIDPATGETIGVLENGMHGALVEYLATIQFLYEGGALTDFILGMTAYTFSFVADRFDKAVGDGSFDQDDYNWTMGAYGTTLTCIGAVASNAGFLFCGTGAVGAATGAAIDPFAVGQKAAEGLLNNLVNVDPPLADNWMALDVFEPTPQHEATTTLPVVASLPNGNLNANLTTDFVAVNGLISANYDSPGAAYQFDTLSLPSGELYEGSELIGSGSITAVSGTMATTNAAVDLTGDGGMSFYASALPNIGNGTHFANAQVDLDGSNLEVTVADTDVTLDGVTYSGDFTILAQSPPTMTGTGPAAAANHAPSATLNGSNLAVTVGTASGTATLNGQNLATDNGFSLASYNGDVVVNDSGSSQQVTLNGTASLFTLTANSATSTTTPDASVSFNADIAANFSDDFALTLTAPDGWIAELNEAQATITPALGAAVGDYDVGIVACPESAPQVCQTAVHTITIQPFDNFTLDVQSDPLTTIPMGDVLADNPRPGNTNTGQAQVPGAAYTIVLTNTANAAHTYTFNVSGLPSNWTLLANRAQGETSSSLTLPAGEVGYLGLYVNPDGNQLPAPGTSHTIQVTAVSDTSAQQTTSVPFVMPSVAFNYVSVEPPVLYLTSTASTDIDLNITNVGNTTGDFPVSTHDAFDAIAVASPLTDVSNLAPGASNSQAVTIASSNAPIGSVYPVFFDSPAPGGVYTQTATLIVQITSQRAGQIMQAGRCSADNDGYPASVQSLGIAVQELETWCDLGDCPAQLRDNVAAAAQETANYGLQIPFTMSAPDLTSAASNLVSQSNDADILLAMDGVATAVTSLGNEVCEVEEHLPMLRWNPYTSAILSSENASYDLELTNKGTVETTYAVTLTLPTGDTFQNVTIPAGQTTTLPVTINNAPDGYHLLTATAVPTAPDVTLLINPAAQARLNVVDKFVQVTAVTSDPPVVDTGISSTMLSIEVANIANVPLDVVAETAVIAPNGTTQATLNPALTLLAGNPRTYELGVMDTSGWAEGTYTITVNLLDETSALIPNGFGYGYLGVGQTLSAQMSSAPLVVAPGTVTVTTIITTEIGVTGVFSTPETFANVAPGEIVSFTEPVSDTDVLPSLLFGPLPQENLDNSEIEVAAPFVSAPAALANTPGYTRYEENDPALLYNGAVLTDTVGAWSATGQTNASGGQTAVSGVMSDTVSLTFTGTAVFLGLRTSDWGGLAQVTIDGAVQEIADTYSNENGLLTRRYADLTAGSHTITVTVLDQRNPFALRDNIYLDFVDVWEGTPLADGTFEAETDGRVYTSGNWNILSNAGASGSQYLERGSTLWFPFTGDSVGFVLPKDRFSNEMRLFVDDQFIDFLDIYSPSFITETISLDGFTSGAHLLRVEGYRGRALADAFIAPSVAPFWQPTDKSGFFRYEEDDEDLQYNGVPFMQTANTWSRTDNVFAEDASDGQFIRTGTVGDSVALTFDGEWVSLGFLSGNRSGQIEVLIDGISQGVYDLFRHNVDPVTIQFGSLGAGVHTVTAVNLGTSNPNSTGARMTVDYIDTWDGTPLTQGLVEAEDGSRTYYSGDLGIVNESGASGGAYVRDSLLRTGNMWFPFTGESITLQTWSGNLDHMRVKIDGIEQPPLDLFNTDAQTRTVNFEGLSTGVHVLELNRYRDDFNADAFIVPAISANFQYPPLAQTGIVRYEENDPAWRYNGTVYSQTVGSWNQDSSFNISSDYVANSGTAGDNVALDFYGSWFGVGFESTSQTGIAEIYVDGVLLDTVDTSGNLGPMSVYYDVVTGTHTISVTAVDRIRVDFIDTWDTTEMPDGWYDADLNDRINEFHYTTYWGTYGNDYAREEEMVGRGQINSRRTVWFAFTGNDLTFRSYNDDGGEYEIYMDGVSQGVYTTTAVYSNQPINWHFPDLGNGPHVFSLRAIDGSSRTYVDAFHVNPEKFVDAAPSIEWFDFTSGSGNGLLTTIAAGDINKDGIVEIIAPDNNGMLYVYRGDGQDAGGGNPIIWSAPVGVSNEPSIADIDLDGYGEVLLLAEDGLFAFEHDGTTKWMTNTVVSSINNGNYGWGGVAIGNLDLDDEPELVVAPSQQQAAVVSADGATIDRFGPTFGDYPTAPILADVNGDGLLDIIVADDETIYVYDYFNGLNLIWSYTYDTSDISANTGSQTWGAPAVANLDADTDPEIIIFFEEKVVALNHDGSELWVYKVEKANGYRPSQVTVADVDGDSEAEIIVAQGLSAGLIILNHEILVLNADGTLLWSEIVKETTSSSSGVATHDFNGDGIWEVLWNGYDDGFLIFNGPDGDRIFNEPRINSGTIIDYPSVVDVDGDHFAEVLLGDGEGLWVVGHDEVWADARPLWSGNSYRITDINDDLSIPINEQPSWLTHNTYRTQTPNRNPAAAYSVNIAYTAGNDQITVLPPTISMTPTTMTPPIYTFSYKQDWTRPVVTLTLVSEVGNLQPGEVRQIADGALVSYTLPTGENSLVLPPLFVTGAPIADFNPAEQTAVPGQTLNFTIDLFNPGATDDTYTLALTGLPSDWGIALPPTVSVLGNGQATATLTLSVPEDADLREYPFILSVTTSNGATQLGGSVIVQMGVEIGITAVTGSLAPIGDPIDHILTITNMESAARTYNLNGNGTPSLTLPPLVFVPANSSVEAPFTAIPNDTGLQAFTVQAIAQENGAADSETAVVQGAGTEGVAVTLSPQPIDAGPGSTAVMIVTVQNLGATARTYDLNHALPADWQARFEANGQPVTEVFVATGVYNSAELTLLVTPADSAVTGSYPISVTATAQENTAVTHTANGLIDLNGVGVKVEILDQNISVNANETASWDVRVTNTGASSDTFTLTAAGIPLGADGSFSNNTVQLAAGASTTVPYMAGDFLGAAPKAYAFSVMAQSNGTPTIIGEDRTTFVIDEQEAIVVAWETPSQTITNTFTTDFTLVLTNTGNAAVSFDLVLDGAGLMFEVPASEIYLPPGMTARLPVSVEAEDAGVFTLMGTAVGGTVQTSDTAMLTVIKTTTTTTTNKLIYLPIILRNP